MHVRRHRVRHWPAAVPSLLLALLASCATRSARVAEAESPGASPTSALPCFRGRTHAWIGSADTVTIGGQPHPQLVAKAVASRGDELEACHRAHRSQAEPDTYLQASVLLSPDGTVQATSILSSTEQESMDACVGQVLCATRFPAPTVHRPVTVFVPIEFRDGRFASSDCYRGRRELHKAPLPAPTVDAGAHPMSAPLRGSLPKEGIRTEIRRHEPQVRGCYERALDHNRELSGRISVLFTISPNGQVLSSSIQSSTLDSAELEDCTGRAVCDWRFQAPDGGGIVIVSYPFNFTTNPPGTPAD
jgi:TonB family protein